MIGRLRGRLLEVAENVALLDVGGVGYEVEVSAPALTKLTSASGEVELHTHLVVREDAHSLFGFASIAERDLFRSLIKINGVGPKLGVTLLSAFAPDEFARCIAEHDTATLKKVPGVGQRTADRLVVDLKDRLDTSFLAATARPERRGVTVDAESALVSLGYKNADAAKVVEQVFVDGATTEDLVRRALKRIASVEPGA